MLRLRETHKVNFDAVDFRGRLSINGLCGYMQIIAANHASALGFNYYKNGQMPEYYWILSRVKYMISEYPKWEDEMVLETYPGGCNKLFAVRLFDLFNQEGQSIGQIIGDYLLMDAARQRPARIKGGQGPLSFLDFPYEGETLEKLVMPEKVLKEEVRKAYYSELDLNGHMNNAHYVKWAVDMLDLDVFERQEIASLQVNFNTSVTYGVEVKVSLGQNETGDFLVSGDSLDGKINYFIASIELRP